MMYRIRNTKRKQRMLSALADMQQMIAEQFPQATFTIVEGDDPPGIYLRPILDIENIFEILDIVADNLYEYQVEQGLPVYVFPARPTCTTVPVS